MPAGLARRLHQLRRARGWTLQQLAERSGVSVGMLSEVERETKNPTVRLVYDIAQAFGCSISDLLEDQPGSRLLVDEEAGLRRESHANPLLHGRLEVVIYQLEPGARSGVMAPNRAGTLETVVVLDGQLALHLDDEVQVLATGESCGHGVRATEYRNPDDAEPCRILVLVDTSRC